MMNNIWLGNCIDIIPKLGQFQFIFADPPYNIGDKYVGYSDDMSVDDYQDFTYDWVDLCWNHCTGVLALHGNDNLAELYLEIAHHYGLRRIAWINWFYKFGQHSRKNWINMREHCLIYAKDNYTWNPEDVLVYSDRVGYSDSRVLDSEWEGKRLPGNIWGLPEDGAYWGRVQGNSKERRLLHPNQLPEVYLKRLILAYTNEGDNVLDPFGGSGTTLVVARALKRLCTTIEISQENFDSIQERIRIGAVRI